MKVNEGTGLSAISCVVDSTALGTPGSISDGGASLSKEIKWTALANAGGSDITNVQKHIKFKQKILPAGIMSISMTGEFADHYTGGSDTLSVIKAGATSPYVKAVATIASLIPTSYLCCVGDAVIEGKCVIENIDTKELDKSYTHTHVPVSDPFNLSVFAVSGTDISLTPNDSRLGSFALTSKVALHDITLNYVHVDITLSSPTDAALSHVNVCSSRPTYGD